MKCRLNSAHLKNSQKFQKKMATETAKCPLCKDKLIHPRLLPCIHSFCLECLENYCRSRDNLPGDDVPCPVCRHEFQIPKDGVAGLTVRTHDKEPAPSSICEACSTDETGISATVYCVDCCQTLCQRCSVPHRKMRGCLLYTSPSPRDS